jgi:hypothetical protein
MKSFREYIKRIWLIQLIVKINEYIVKAFDSFCRTLRKYVYLLPIVQIIATFVVSFFELTDNDFVYLGNSVGYSVITGLVYVAYFRNVSFCAFTRFSAIGLFLIAIYNLIGVAIEYDIYTMWFDRIVFAIVLILTFKLRKND